MKHIGLFEGIGGFSLAARWMSWQTIAWCEINPFCQTILKYHFPHAKAHSDIKQTGFTIYRGQCDILTGGFPCQPYSTAGKRLGKEDDRHLWPEMLRAIQEIQPSWVVGENVRGIINWNGGMVFDEVQADLEAEGYEVLPFLLPACAVNAPHRRDRVWFIAHSNLHVHKRKLDDGGNKGEAKGGERKNEQQIGRDEDGKRFWPQSGPGGEIITDSSGNGQSKWQQNKGWQDTEKTGTGMEFRPERLCNDGITANTCNERLQGRQFNGASNKERQDGRQQPSGSATQFHKISNWRNFPTQSPVCGRNDGISGKLDGITFSKWRNESIKSDGNAIVPQVAYQIFKAIEYYQELINHQK